MSFPQRSLERLSSLCHGPILNTIWNGATYGMRAYIYQESAVADMELSTPQYILLALLHSLVTGDTLSCCLLADLCHQVRQLQSDHLSVWLTRDFVFPRQDMENAMALFSDLLKTNALKLPHHVTRIISSLTTKYGINSTQLSMEGNIDLAKCLEEAVLNDRPGDIIAIASKGGDVNGSTQYGESLIHLATRLGNSCSIAALGFLKANLEVLNSNNATPLQEAIKNNCASPVKVLLSSGAKPDMHLFRGDTYLHIAAAEGRNEALKVLLEGGLDLNKKNHLDETPLFQAIRANNVQAVEMLLEKGADTGIVPDDSKNLLEMAMELQNVEIFQALMKTGTQFDSEDGNSIFHLLGRLGNSEMLTVAKELGLSANLKNRNSLTPFHIALDNFVLKTLIRMGLDVNDRSEKGETALFMASSKGPLEMVRSLCQEGAVVDTQDNDGISALMSALKNSKDDIATLLLLKGANPNIKDNEGRTALHYAAERGCTGLVTTLLEAGARINDKDNNGRTPAFVASVNNKVAVLEELVESGADLALKDLSGNEILHHAAHSGYLEIVKVLLDAGVAVDAKGKDHWTPLHYAVQRGHLAVAEDLLDYGADSGAKTVSGRTPLMIASIEDDLAMVQLLINHGATVNTKDNHGWIALDWSRSKGHAAVPEYLRTRGGV
ncbi:putative ankyrin repeat protein RF_0381 [Halyomorpha halys]|uniref:putative ankyrin repeat protein RF_0381 n=1 Tax=Halyomorpha halys TaxID=286706 RepID=UPI0006D5265F|nr:uncharacterized protein LOC106679877 [Halyomorpha halys]XP_014274747.1 uncharacterized protein LOC106679877 [Halyomorpha halys]XP_014274748.1 uncharacterized protein LOC106679877 [Halyomorpha halys]